MWFGLWVLECGNQGSLLIYHQFMMTIVGKSSSPMEHMAMGLHGPPDTKMMRMRSLCVKEMGFLNNLPRHRPRHILR